MMNPVSDVCAKFTDIDLDDTRNEDHPLNESELDECEEVMTTDSEDYLSENSRYQSFMNSSASDMSTSTLQPHLSHETRNFSPCNGGYDLSNIEIPIVGYEVMEERARFTVYKLRIENKASGESWYVFRRYTDFVRLCNRLKHKYPHIAHHLPHKRILRNNFDPVFLESRVCGLQTLVNALLGEPELTSSQLMQDFFCLNEPPVYSETNEESRAMFEALEDTIYQLKQQLRDKEATVDNLQDKLQSKSVECENLRKIVTNSTMNCQKCQKDCENITKMLN